MGFVYYFFWNAVAGGTARPRGVLYARFRQSTNKGGRESGVFAMAPDAHYFDWMRAFRSGGKAPLDDGTREKHRVVESFAEI